MRKQALNLLHNFADCEDQRSPISACLFVGFSLGLAMGFWPPNNEVQEMKRSREGEPEPRAAIECIRWILGRLAIDFFLIASRRCVVTCDCTVELDWQLCNSELWTSDLRKLRRFLYKSTMRVSSLKSPDVP